MTEYRPGAIIRYRNNAGEVLRVLVTEREESIKNGSPGFGGYVVTEDNLRIKDETGVNEWREAWGYDDQIIEIVTPR